MAEGVAAFSLAANILQFIDFGARVVSNFWSFYKSNRKEANNVPDFSAINADLQRVLSDLQLPYDDGSGGDIGLVELAKDCRCVAEELKTVLQSLFKARVGNTGKRDALMAAFKLAWREDEIRSLQEQLNQFKHQLVIHLLASMREQVRKSLQYQQELFQELNAVHEGNKRLEGKLDDLASNGEGLGTLLLDFVTTKIDSSMRENKKWQLRKELMVAIYRGEEDECHRSYLPPFVTDVRQHDLYEAFLAKLRYEKMEDREGRVAEAYGSTFQWVFEDSSQRQKKWFNFRDWLKSDSQLYWITGKAGSGKSTLMKYICSTEMGPASKTSTLVVGQPRYAQFLAEWAQDCNLIIAVFYFWNSGIELQTRRDGLFRTLLTQIFTQTPELIPRISPERWEALCFFNEDNKDWTETELQNILQSTVKDLGLGRKMCLFIDGLDEFGGDHEELIRLFKDLLENPAVKLCVSSRPWVLFEDAFQKQPSLTLQDLTYHDIKQYVSSHLHVDTGFALLRDREPSYAEKLVENIVAKASGVFLWVRIVVSSLLSGLGHGDRISDLQRRLNSLPPELEELYDKILSSLDPFYLEHAAQLFKLVHESTEPPSVLLLCYADEGDDLQKILDLPVQEISQREAVTIFEIVRRRLNSRCKGFLEAPAVYKPILDESDENGASAEIDIEKCTVQFLHRTVKDYIESPTVQQKLQLAMKAPFDVHLRFCVGSLAMLKTTNQSKIDLSPKSFLWTHIDRFMNSAEKVSAMNQDAVVQLMDDLDRTGKTLAKIVVSREEKILNGKVRQLLASGQWITKHVFVEAEVSSIHFLSLATRRGILSYLRARVTKGCLVQRMSCSNKDQISTIIHPLLLDAIDSEEPNPAIVKLFLEKGADPNFQIGPRRGDCVWRCAKRNLGVFLNKIWKRSQRSQEWWISAVILMIEHGGGHYSKQQRRLLLERLMRDRNMLLNQATIHAGQELAGSWSDPPSAWLSLQLLVRDEEAKLIIES